jgi:integrase
MAVRTYIEDGKKLYEVYVNGFNSRGVRIQRKRKGIETLRKAETIEFELMRELSELKELRGVFTWSEWFDECMKRMKLELMGSTLASYKTQMKKWVHPHWASTEIRKITKSDVYDLIFTKCEGIQTQYTRRNILKQVKRILQMAVEEGILDRNPCTGVSVRVTEVVQKVLTTSEVEIFLQQARLVNHRFYPLWAMALMTGMRSGELFALNWTDIDFDGRTISVSKAWNSKCGITPTKTRRSRIVPISDELLSFLKERKLKFGAESPSVLPRLGEWEHGEQARVTREFCAGIGITSVKFHDLRATFITNLLARGTSLAVVMSIVGHSELKTTNGYLRKAGVDVQGGTDKLGYRLPQESEAKVFSIFGKAKSQN